MRRFFYICSILPIFILAEMFVVKLHAQVEELVSQQRREELAQSGNASIAEIKRTVENGKVIRLRIMLVEESDILLLTGLDESYLTVESTSRTRDEIVFALRAKKAGNTYVSIERISRELQRPYLRFALTIAPSSEERLEQALRLKNQKKQISIVRDQRAAFIDSLISQGFQDRAEQEMEGFLADFGAGDEYGVLMVKLFSLQAEKDKKAAIDGIRAFLTNEKPIPKNFNKNKDEPINYFAQARIVLAQLLYETGEKADAIVELISAQQNYPNVEIRLQAALKLADLLFKDGKHGEANKYYKIFMEEYDRAEDSIKEKLSEQNFVANYRLAETLVYDSKLRDYQIAFQMFTKAEKLLPMAKFENGILAKRQWSEKINERKSYLNDHFLKVR